MSQNKTNLKVVKLFLSIIIIAFSHNLSIAQSRTVIELSENWKFQKGQNDNAFFTDFDDSLWQLVSVPHDWAIYGPFDQENDKYPQLIEQNLDTEAYVLTGRTGALPFIGEGWYRKNFTLPENYTDGQKVLISFDGAMSQPEVFLNGEKIGEWNYGYNYFWFDITDDVLTNQENVLAVRCKNLKQSSRWYPGAGLYRKVQLIIKNTESINHWGINITTPQISPELAKVNVKTKVSEDDLTLVTMIIDPDGILINSDTTQTVFINEFEQNILVKKPQLWSPENPKLYKVISKVFNENGLTDETITNFGIRTISYTPEGFKLNGEICKFKGVCLHHDLGPLGTAINISALRRQLTILKDLGCNAIRSAHNMPSIEQLELCDEMGFLFLAESFDEWAVPKVKNGYNLFFNTDVEKDIVNLVNATRNHPCIVMWSAGNEVPDQKSSEGVKRAKMIVDIFHREDPTRPVTVGMDQVENSMRTGFGAVLDVPGLNYRTHLYSKAYEKFPQGFLLGSETASTISSRGIYKFPVAKTDYQRYEDHQCCSYDLGYCSWSNLPDDDFALQDDYPWVIGEFVWTGFDYLGEPTPYSTNGASRSSYFGIVDLSGIPKDRFYLYRSRWNNNESTLHILPHWSWPGREGKVTPVFVYTSYNSAELFVNGISQGIQTKNDSTLQHRNRLMWMNVKYEPGNLKVIAFDDEGKTAQEATVRTAGKPYKIILDPDRSILNANGDDIAFVTVSVVDKNGNPCPSATNQLNFKVSGSGTYRAACNGDPTSLEMFHIPTMKLFSGKLVILVQSSEKQGIIKLKVDGKGLKGASLSLISMLDAGMKY